MRLCEVHTAHTVTTLQYYSSVACDLGLWPVVGMGFVVISGDLESLFITKGRKGVVAALNSKGHFFGSDLC